MKLLLALGALVGAASAAHELAALAYNPKQLDSGRCPTVDTVRDDLSVLAKYTDEVRIYSVKDCNQGEPVLRAMEGTEWKIQLGLWVNKNDDVYEKDKAELIRLAGIFDFNKHVTAVIVGNEAIYREEQTSAQIAAKVRDTRAALAMLGLGSIPVTTSETWPSYDQVLIDAVDYVNMHAFPFWEGVEINSAQSKVFEHIYDLKRAAGNKTVAVGETGWPDAGGNYGAAAPSATNEQRYMKEFVCRARLENIRYVWFSAFDEAWKPSTNASSVEAHWGILRGDKTPKFPSPMYDCKGFVPSSKPYAKDSVSSESASEHHSGDREEEDVDSKHASDSDDSSGAHRVAQALGVSVAAAIAWAAAAAL
ncbi:glycoside hydrolase 3 protein [Coemansia spiralis]|nr:glycoside hydrolase 3 protein [Coemansia spiralis]